MAGIAVGDQASRARLERALRDLEESHLQLTSYAARVAELSCEAERTRLARDIHDSLGHHLTAIAVQLEKAAAFRDRDAATADQALADARSSARQALDDVRLSVRALRGEPPGTLAAMLGDLVRQAGGGAEGGPLATLSVDGLDGLDGVDGVDGDGGQLSGAARTVLYRAAQEALTNARRHSGARRVSVSLTFTGRYARLVVADDGRGFDPAARAAGGGFGLVGMRERAALAGGRAEVDSCPGGGTTVTVTVPRAAVPAARGGGPVDGGPAGGGLVIAGSR
jgi:signal transduction histidine kinase